MVNINEQWAEVLKILEEEIPSESYNAWVLPLVPSEIQNGKITLLSPYSFTNFALKQSYGATVAKALQRVFGERLAFEVLKDTKLEELYKKQQKREEKEEKKRAASLLVESKYDGLKQMQSDSHLNTKYTFDNFVVGDYNKLAYSAAKGIACGNGKKAYNPLFIYGGSGLGKTHLLFAIGNYMMSKGKLKVRYITTEEFLNDYINSLVGNDKNKKMNIFRQKYRDVDVLLIDDIQQLEGKEGLQKELFNTFNDLYNANKYIILTSDRLPSEIPTLSERLRTRFESGLMADIGLPDLETRMAIVKQLIESDGAISMSLEVIKFLANVYKNNIRELEGGFNKITAVCSCFNEEPTLETVKKAINYTAVQKQITAESISGEVAKFYGVTIGDIQGKSRVGNIANARKVAVYIVREITGNSWQSIGDALGGRKYSTIMVLYKGVKDEMPRDTKLADEINTLFNIINQT
jgi:chromosomal replication initiator protein